MSWTTEQKAEIIRMCADLGNSATTTASILSKRWSVHMTRNMVIGVVNRAGRKCGSAESARQRGGRSKKSRVKTARKQTAVQKAGITAAPAPEIEITIDTTGLKASQDVRALQIIADDARAVPPAGAQGILRRNEHGKLEANPELHDNACRWPLADPKLHAACFCAKTKVSGLPYCEDHARRAYAGLPPAKDKPQQPARRFERVR